MSRIAITTNSQGSATLKKKVSMKILHFPDEHERMSLRRRDTFTDFFSRDGNREVNSRILLNVQGGVTLSAKIHGKTFYGPYAYNFPVRCSARVFADFLDYLATVDACERRALLCEGIVSLTILHGFPQAWSLTSKKDLLLGSIFLFIWESIVACVIACCHSRGVLHQPTPDNDARPPPLEYDSDTDSDVPEFFSHDYHQYDQSRPAMPFPFYIRVDKHGTPEVFRGPFYERHEFYTYFVRGEVDWQVLSNSEPLRVANDTFLRNDNVVLAVEYFLTRIDELLEIQMFYYAHFPKGPGFRFLFSRLRGNPFNENNSGLFYSWMEGAHDIFSWGTSGPDVDTLPDLILAVDSMYPKFVWHNHVFHRIMKSDGGDDVKWVYFNFSSGLLFDATKRISRSPRDVEWFTTNDVGQPWFRDVSPRALVAASIQEVFMSAFIPNVYVIAYTVCLYLICIYYMGFELFMQCWCDFMRYLIGEVNHHLRAYIFAPLEFFRRNERYPFRHYFFGSLWTTILPSGLPYLKEPDKSMSFLMILGLFYLAIFYVYIIGALSGLVSLLITALSWLSFSFVVLGDVKPLPPLSIFVGLVRYLPGVVVEEYVKHYLVHSAVFGFVELCLKFQFNYGDPHMWLSVFPFLMHVATGFLPFHERVFFHYLWNTFVADALVSYFVAFPSQQCVDPFSFFVRGSMEEVLGNCKEMAFCADLILKAYRGDAVGLTLSFAMRADYVANLLKITGEDKITDVIESTLVNVQDYFGSKPKTTLTAPAFPENPPFWAKLVPDWVSKSPNGSWLLGLLVVLSSAHFVEDSTLVTKLSEFIDWSGLRDSADPMIFVAKALSAIWKGIMSFTSTGNFYDLFGRPDEIKFIHDADRFLHETPILRSEEEWMVKIGEIDKLIDSRTYKYKQNTSVVLRKIDQLRDYQDHYRLEIAKRKPRLQPMPIFLVGDPGFGKTVLIEAIIGRLARRFNGEPPKIGSVANLVLDQKFPGEATAHPEAEYMVFNDIPSDYSNAAANDKPELDVILQQLVDTSMFTLNSAAIEKKEQVYSKVRQGIFSSNHMSYVFANACEKLTRRLKTGLIVKCSLVDAKGNPVPWEYTNGKTPGERNALMRFTVCKVECKNKHMKFIPTEVVLDLQAFFTHLDKVVAAHEKACQSDFVKFFSPDSQCKCGVPTALHWTKEMFHERMVDTFRLNSKACFEHCKAHDQFRPIASSLPPEEANPAEIFMMNEEYSPPPVRLTPMQQEASVSTVLTSENVFEDIGKLTVALLFLSWAMWMFVHSEACMRFLIDKFVWHMDTFYATNPVFKRAFQVRARLSSYPDLHAASFKLWLAYHKMKRMVLERKKQILAALAVLALVGYAIYRKRQDTNGSTLTGKPIFVEDVDPNSWLMMGFDREINYTPDQARKWGKVEQNMNVLRLEKNNVGVDLCDRVKSNLFNMFISDGISRLAIRVLAMTPEWLLINKHYLFDKNKKMYGNFFLWNENGEVPQAYSIKDVVFVPGKEFVFVKNYHFRAVQSLHTFLPRECTVSGLQVIVVSDKEKYESVAFHNSFDAHGEHFSSYEWRHVGKPGDCMSIAIGKADKLGCFILAPVSYSKSHGMAGGCPITRADFELACSSLIYPSIEHVQLTGLPHDIDVLSPNSDLRNVISSNLLPVGTVVGGVETFHSKLTKTVLFNDFYPLLSQGYDIPQRVRGVNSAGEYTSAFVNQMESINGGNRSTFTLRYRSMMAYLFDVKPKNGETLRPLELSEAMLGCEDMGVDRINFKTATGARLKERRITDKYKLFTKNEETGLLTLDQTFVADVKKTIDNISCGVLESVTVTMAVKDEVRTTKKLSMNKLRLFGVLDFHYNIIVRMYIMPLITYLLKERQFSECFGQMNAGSKEWTQLAEYLSAAGPNYIDMDFACFDTSHDAPMFEIVAMFFFELSRMLGYKEEESKVVYFAVLMLCVQVMIYKKDVAIKLKGMPSGVVITLILNSIINSILMRMAYYTIFGQLNDFKSNVHAATTGDDNVCGVSDKVIGKYNILTIAPLYAQWGYKVTPASKDGVMKERLDLSEAVFLKRRFVFDAELGFYLAPLEKDSILKAVCFEDVQAETTKASRMIDVARGVQREAFLHGREYFDEMQERMKQAFIKHETSLGGAEAFPELSYDLLRDEFLDGKFRTFAC